MKKILLACLLILAASICGHAQVTNPDCFFSATVAASGRAAIYDNRGLVQAQPVCTTWQLMYFNDGFSALSVELDEAPSSSGGPGTWVTWPNLASGALPLTATTQGQITAYKYFPWVSINVNSVTGTGTIRVEAYGYRPGLAQDVNVTPAGGGSGCNGAANGSAVSGNPCLIAGSDGTNVRTLGATSLGALAILTNQTPGDSFPNTGVNSFATTANLGSAAVAPTAGFLFNGSTWDKLVKCGTAFPITLGAAGTSQLVAPVAGKLARLCGLFLEITTTGTLTITEGTGATCGTGTTNVSGTMTAPVGAMPILTAGSSVMQTNVSGDGLCITSGTAVGAGWAQTETH